MRKILLATILMSAIAVGAKTKDKSESKVREPSQVTGDFGGLTEADLFQSDKYLIEDGKPIKLKADAPIASFDYKCQVKLKGDFFQNRFENGSDVYTKESTLKLGARDVVALSFLTPGKGPLLEMNLIRTGDVNRIYFKMKHAFKVDGDITISFGAPSEGGTLSNSIRTGFLRNGAVLCQFTNVQWPK